MPIYCSPEDDIGFVYVWFNVTNHRYYIGSHKGHPNDGYIGSGFAFKSAYKKYGPENFVRHIEYYGPDYRQEETDLIKFFDACNCSESYNLMHVDITGYSVSDETRAKIGASSKNRSDETRAKLSAAKKGKKQKPFTEERRAKMSASRTGKKHSDETRAKMSAAQKSKRFQKVTCPHCDKTGGINNMKRWHFENCKFKSHK